MNIKHGCDLCHINLWYDQAKINRSTPKNKQQTKRQQKPVVWAQACELGMSGMYFVFFLRHEYFERENILLDILTGAGLELIPVSVMKSYLLYLL